MHIADIIKSTVVDFPGKVSCTVYTQGCDRHCPHCHNTHLIPLADKNFAGIDWLKIINFLIYRQSLLDAVVFSGGEPTLQPDLPDRMREVKAMGFQVGLHTNGDFLTPEIARLCDYILLSQYNDDKIAIAKRAGRLQLSQVVKVNSKWENQITDYKGE